MKIQNSKVSTFLMFEGCAEEAMRFYTSVIPDSDILSIKHYGKEEAGKEGTVHLAHFTLGGQAFMCIDSPAKHAFTFTPSISIFVNCDSEAEMVRLYEKLLTGGSALMPLGEYGFSKKFGWVSDRYGVSWQVNLPS